MSLFPSHSIGTLQKPGFSYGLRIRFRFVMSLALVLSPAFVKAATEVCGTFKLAAEWTIGGSPYIVTGDIFIPANSRLRIGPGVTVRFTRPRPCESDPGHSLIQDHKTEDKHDDKGTIAPLDWSDSVYTGIEVEGTFYCLGTEDQPVIFESENFKGGVIGWDGIRLLGQNTRPSEISFGIFRGANQAITAEKTEFFIHHCLFIQNNTGITLGFRGDVKVVNCNFISNLSAGMVIRKAGARIVSNLFFDNRSYGIWADGRPAIQIHNNAFWANREEACRKCPYQVLQLGKLNANKDTSDAFGNLMADPIFIGTASFDSARQADVQTDTPVHLVKDPKLAELEAKARKKTASKDQFVALGKGDFLLSQYSKLKDAGYKSRDLRDRDGTPNDIGWHGGPMTRITKDPF